MDAEIKNRWIRALRSGEYNQATGTLYDPEQNGYCCLGVLCEIARDNGVVTRKVYDTFSLYFQESDYDDARSGSLPQVVQDWAGIESSDPKVMTDADGSGYRGQYRLSELNDFCLSFDQIADAIESSL